MSALRFVPRLAALAVAAALLVAPACGRAQGLAQGPGGPILVITHADNPFTAYFAEILRAEGFDCFRVIDQAALTAPVLAEYDVAILGEMPLNQAYVDKYTNWVNAGGNLIAMRPDSGLAGLLGLAPATGTLSDAYLRIDDSDRPGAGLVGETIQFHGTADLYDLAGAAAVAALYVDATTATAHPAVTWRAVGTGGGQAAAFTYDLARSVVLTRQGNPAWAGQERDGDGRVRTNDLFVGDTPGTDDWIDLDKVHIPQADEQQRLLANLITAMCRDRLPQPRFWYFPRGHKAVVVMTNDDHNGGYTTTRFDEHLAQSPVDCSLEDWECVRSTAYIYPGNPMTDAQADAYEAQGFEIALHIDTGCDTPWADQAALEAIYNAQFPPWLTKYASVAPPVSERGHCVTWADWASKPIVQRMHGIRLDVTYYYENVPAWGINAHPGMFTGSGIPMRFANLDGTMIDVFQVTTQMTDESGQSYPATVEALLDKALGPEGYYGAFCVNMHSDYAVSNGSINAPIIVAAAQARGVPVVTARQMLTWLDGRNASSFGSLAWSADTLSFTVSRATAARGLEGMVPTLSATGVLSGIARDGVPLTYRTETIKGEEYAFFAAESGSHVAVYEADPVPPSISGVAVTPGIDGRATFTWTTDEPATSRVDYGTDPDALASWAANAARVISHSLVVSGLAPGTTYYFRVSSADLVGNVSTLPEPPAAPAAFTTPHGVCFLDTAEADFGAGVAGTGVQVAGGGGGEVILAPAAGSEFGGDALPGDWFSDALQAGGTAQVTGGDLRLNGARAGVSATVATGRSLEFEATFNAVRYEHVGFGLTLQEYPYAVVTTSGDGASLRAHTRLSAETGLLTVLPGSLLGAPHRFRLDWDATGVTYSVDGVEAVRHDLAIGTDLRPVASDTDNDGLALVLHWVHMTPYAAEGTFTSRVYDSGGAADWEVASWTATTPPGTSVQLFARRGDTPAPDAGWTPFVQLAAPGAVVGGTSQFVQYRADLQSGDPSVTPALHDFGLSCLPGPDNIAPFVSGLTATPGPDGTTAVVSWATNEPASSLVEYGRQAGLLDQSASDAALVTAHGVALAGLTPGRLYYYRIVSADAAGNPTTSPPVGEPPAQFTTPLSACAVDASAADFALGTLSDVYLAGTGDGELLLTPAVGAEFDGDALPAGWTLIQQAPGGTVVVSGGSLTVDGSRPGTSALYAPGRSLEFVGQFRNVANQHVGFGETFGEYHWAIFSTGGDGATLKARTRQDAVLFDTVLPGAYLNSSHRFRIDWGVSGVDFFVDGALVAHHDIAVTSNLRPLVSDTLVDGVLLTVDWLRMTPYGASGTFQSRVFDAGAGVAWNAMSWTCDLPAGTTVSMSARVGPTPAPDGTWTEFVPVPVSGTVLAQTGRYLQYQAGLATADAGATPVLDEVRVLCDATTAVPDQPGMPALSYLRAPAPNPFNPRTTLGFALARPGRVTLRLYGLDGRLVRTLVDAELVVGSHEAVWDGADDRGRRVASGVYFARLVAPDRTETARMMLIK